MAKLFIYAEETASAGEMMALAKELGQQICAFSLNDADARELIAYGADKVYILKGTSPRPEAYVKTMAKVLSGEPSMFFVAATVRGRDVAAQAAALCDCALISDAGRVSMAGEGTVETERMMYGGAVVITEQCSAPAVVIVPPGKYTAVRDEARTGDIETITAEEDLRVKQTNLEKIVRQGTDITKASKIVCVGMGFDKKEDLSMAQDLANALGAEVAATRPLTEDRKWLPAELYVGISGAVISPDLYIGMGLSGQIQHTYGIRDAKIIVGINNNDKAPIFQMADYGIVGDMYEVVPVLTEAIKGLGQ